MHACRNTDLAGRFGPLNNIASDGAQPRRQALYELAEKHELPREHPVHGILAPLLLLDMKAHESGLTVNFDEKHCGKRLAERVKSPMGMQVGPVHLDRWAVLWCTCRFL